MIWTICGLLLVGGYVVVLGLTGKCPSCPHRRTFCLVACREVGDYMDGEGRR